MQPLWAKHTIQRGVSKPKGTKNQKPRELSKKKQKQKKNKNKKKKKKQQRSVEKQNNNKKYNIKL